MKIDFCFLICVSIFGLTKAQVPKDLIEINSFLNNIDQTSLSRLQALYHNIKLLSSDFKNFELDNIQLSDPCGTDIKRLINGLRSKQDWSIKTIDSFAKPPTGILKGSINWLGDYDECIETENQTVSWYPKYCAVSKNLDPSKPIFFKYGFCSPKTCTSQDIAEILNFVFKKIGKKNETFDQNNIVCQIQNTLDTPAWIMILVSLILIAVVFLATIIELVILYCKNPYAQNPTTLYIQINEESVSTNLLNSDNIISEAEPTKPLGEQLISALSLLSNFKKIFLTDLGESQLSSLHGIRVITLGWIILGHSYAFIVPYVDNPLEAFNFIKRFSFTIVSNAFFAVDSFFLIGGVLTGYLFFKITSVPNFKFTAKFFIKYILNRILRLSPAYFFMLFFSIYLTKYLGTGPMYSNNGFEQPICRTKFWKNLFYLNNFQNTNETCFGISWYLANDMQFHLLAPIVLIPLALNKMLIGKFVSGLLIVVNVVSTFFSLYYHPGSELGILGENSQFFYKWVYIKPWTRSGPFLIGLLVGYILFHHKKPGYNPKIRFIFNFLNWNIAQNVMGLCVFIIYSDLRLYPSFYFNRIDHIIYQSCTKIFWALAVGYVIYACETRNGGYVAKFFSWKVFVPLSRLSYSAFLSHQTFIFYFYMTQRRLFHLFDINLIYFYVGNLLGSYLMAVPLSLFVEAPFLALQKILIK